MLTAQPSTTHFVNRPAFIEMIVLTGTGTMLLRMAFSGVLVFYIHPRYTPLVVICGIVLLLIAATRLRAIVSKTQVSMHGRRLRYAVLAVPLLLGTLVPTQPLGAGAMSDPLAGITGASLAITSASADADTQVWNLLQWRTALSIQSEDLSGRPVDVTGFVYHAPGQASDRFIVTRYVIICCAADRNGVGLPVQWNGGSALPADAWVRVHGTLDTTTSDQSEASVRATTVEVVSRPDQPYLYP